MEPVPTLEQEAAELLEMIRYLRTSLDDIEAMVRGELASHSPVEIIDAYMYITNYVSFHLGAWTGCFYRKKHEEDDELTGD